MNKYLCRLSLTLIAGFLSIGGVSAQDLGVSLINSHADWARVDMNPAYIPSTAKTIISLPAIGGISVGVQTPLSLDGIVTRGAKSNVIYLDQVLRDASRIPFSSAMQLNLLGVGIRSKKSFVTLQAGLNMQSDILIDRALSDFLTRGNQGSLGTEVRTQGIRFNAQTYLQVALGYARSFADGRLIVGGRIKLLSGVASARTLDSRLDIYTSQHGDRAVLNSMQRIGFVAPITIPQKAGDLPDFGNISLNKEFAPKAFDNIGLGFDLGVDLTLARWLRLGLSLTDVGSIHWKTNTRMLTSDLTGDNAVVYQGYDFTPDITGERGRTKKNNLDDLATQIEQSLKTSSSDSYRTYLPTQLRLSATLQPAKWVSLTGLVSVRSVFEQRYMQYALVGQLQPTRGIGLSASANHIPGVGTSFGGALVLGRSVQLLLASDLTMANYTSTTSTAIRLGLNFRF